MANITITVGPAGDHTTLQAAWNALPATIDAADTYYIDIASGVYGALDYAANNVTINGRVHIRPQAGDAWYENINLTSDSLNYLSTRGVVISAGVFLGSTVYVQGKVTLDGLQILSPSGEGPLRVRGDGWLVDRCILVADGTSKYPFGAVNAAAGDIQNSLLISQTTDAAKVGLQINDTNGKTINVSNNLLACVGGGGGKWLQGVYGTGTVAKNNAVFGFAAGDDARVSSSSANNCTDLASLPGTGNLVSQTVTDHIQSLAAPFDGRVKATSTMLDAGVDTGLTYDITNQARTLPLSIGVQEAAAGGASDTTPDPFTFNDQTDVALSTLTTSNTVTITGIDASTPISITGGEYSVNGGAYTSASGNVVVNDTVTVRQTSSASYSTQTDTVLDVGGVTDTFSVTTIAQPAGTITTEPLKNNTGTLIANDTGLTVDVYSIATGALIYRATGETTDASGVCTVTDASITPATAYTVVVRRSTNAIGVAEITAT